MQSLNILYSLVPRGEKRMDLTMPIFLRGIYLVLGGLLILVLSRSLGWTHPLVYLFAVGILMVILSEDRWIFDLRAGTMKRRVGFILGARTTSLPLEAIRGININKDAKGSMSQDDPYAQLKGAVGKGTGALRLVLDDGRVLTICLAGKRRYDALKRQAEQLASFLGIALMESRPESIEIPGTERN